MTANKAIFYIVSIICVMVIYALSPITQPQDYHQFAEQRHLLAVPHFGDVLSNLAFVVAGVALLLLSRKSYATELYPGQTVLFKGLAFSSITLGLGSGYYHWAPEDYTLAWDRAAMVLGFAIIFYDSCVRYGVFNARHLITGVVLTTVACLLTVPFWMQTGQLGPYVFVQFFTMFALVSLAIKNYKSVPSKHLFLMFIWYALAKVFETTDKQIFAMTSELVSGHTLKHLAYAVALFMFGKDMLVRKTQ